MKKLFLGVLGVIVFVLSASIVLAQTETGQISGTVLDQQGGGVAKAKVTITNTATGAMREATTDDRGVFVVTNLLPTTYSVTVEAEGFTKREQRVAVGPGAKISVDMSLEVGNITQTVVVSELATSVNTESQTIGQIVSAREIEDLPLLTRNPYDLVGGVGNVSKADDASLTKRGAGYNINGLRAASTNVLLDGAANNDEFGANIGQTIPVESMQEFNVLTNNFTAEYGRAAAGVVNVTTKSGTNDFHGSIYEFGRYSRLAAATFDDNANGIKKAPFTRNQFGYSIGGPIKRNKLVFFQNTEWLRIRSSATQVVVIPAPQLIAAAPANTQAFFTKLGTVRSNFQPLNSLSRADLIAKGQDPCPATGKCATLFSAGSTTPLFIRGQYRLPSDAGAEDPQNLYNIVGRLDWNIDNDTQLYGRYALFNRQKLAGTNVNSPYRGYDTGSTDKDNSFLLTLIHTFSPKLTSQSKIVFNRLNNLQPLGAAPVGPTLFMFSNTTGNVDGVSLAFPGYGPFSPGNAIPFGGPQNFVQAYQDLNSQHGRHGFRFGGSYTYIRDNRTFGAYQEAVETLSTSNFRTGVENFLNGNLAQFQAAVYPQGKFPCAGPPIQACTLQLPVGPPVFARSNRYHEFGAYFQDSWKTTNRLTLNLGIRWDYFGVQHNKNANLDSNYYDARGGNIFENIRNGSVATVPNSPIHGLWSKEWNNFAPRVGFAWDVFGNGKTSFRGGYGIAYERNFGNVTFNVIQNPPNYAVVSLSSNADVPGFIQITTDNSGPLAGSTGSKALPKLSLRNVDPNLRNAYAHLWSLSLERELARNFILGLDYTGSKGQRLYSIENPNRAGSGNIYLGDPISGAGCAPLAIGKAADPSCTRLRNTQYTNINRRGGNGFSLYNGLVARAEIRAIGTTGLSLRANYTYSHAFDNLSSTFSESANNGNLGLLDPFNPKLDRGNADFDLRHQVGITGVWDVPFARNTSGFTKRVFDGWIISTIVSARTGFPFTEYDCTNAFAVCPRAMVGSKPSPVGVDNAPAKTPNTFNYLNLGAIPFDSSYANPVVGLSDFGPFPGTMLPRNYFRAPGAYNVDMGITKTTKVSERFAVQLRGEFFNLLNHSNLYVVYANNDISSTNFVRAHRGVKPGGQPNERRNIQLALKLIF